MTAGGQDLQNLRPHTSIDGPQLHFEWAAIETGIASYEEGPTGVTVFRFPTPVAAAVDVRGGAPGTVNSDVMRLGADAPFLDALVFTGGSMYGEGAIAAVTDALEERGFAGTDWGHIGVVTGAVIYDFQNHRLNDIHPDAALARAAFEARQPGVFPLGAQGAGRAAVQGDFYGCAAHSGQGGAFRRIGDIKIAAFTVVNASGAVTDRAGNIVSCHRNSAWAQESTAAELLARVGTGTLLSHPGGAAPTHNTTLSLIAVNRKLNAFELQRLAVQVHTSMARAIQPFSTEDDGDTLFAVSSGELDYAAGQLSDVQLDTIAGEVMWDAILASVPEDPGFTAHPAVHLAEARLDALAGRYRFGKHTDLIVELADGELRVQSTGPSFLDIPNDRRAALTPQSDHEFYIDGRYRTRFQFVNGDTGRELIVNPGRWAQHGQRVPR